MSEKQTKAGAPGRVVGLDVARGALMAYVVIAIHGMFWLRLVPWDIASTVLFEMPLIFMISGAAFFYANQRDSGAPYGRYLIARGVRVLAPYFAYAVFCAALIILMRGESGPQALETLLAWLNPINGGAGHAAPMLNWHLWFVAPFLVVVALMPLMARAQPLLARAPLWLLAAAAALLSYGADLADLTRLGSVQTVIFYALWAWFGYVLAANAGRYRVADFAAVLLVAAAALIALVVALPGQINLNMQTNKFPPNAIFFLFCAIWVGLFLILSRLLSPAFIDMAARSPLLRPFIDAGYSIYLWQGLGYWAAVQAGQALGWNNLAIWPMAVALTVILGLLASPLERIRLPKPRATTAQPA